MRKWRHTDTQKSWAMVGCAPSDGGGEPQPSSSSVCLLYMFEQEGRIVHIGEQGGEVVIYI